MNKFMKLIKVNMIALLYQTNILSRVRGKRGKINPSKSTEKKSVGKTIFFIGITLLVISALISYISFYNYIVGTNLKPYNVMWILPASSFILASFLVLITGIYTSAGFLFTGKDLDRLFSYPIKQWQILFSKIFSMLIENWIVCLVFIGPSLGVYYYFENPPPVFFLNAILGVLLIPMIPLTISIIFSYLINFFSMGLRFKSFFNILFTTLIILGISIGSKFLIGSIGSIAGSSDSIINSLKYIYAPLGFLISAFMTGNAVDTLIFIVVSFIPFVILVFLMSLKYRVIWSKLSSRKAPPAKRHRIKASGIIFALLKKEAGKYFSSPIYVMNTGIGPILMIIFAISTVFLGRDVVTLLKMPEIAGYIVPGTIAIFCFSASMTSTTAPSISLEGSNLWIIKSSPIEAKDVFWAKLLLNFAVAIPALVVSAIVAGIGLQIAPLEFLWVILLPTLLLILTALVGLIMNLFYHRFDFYNDTQVVKQSASVILTFLIMWILLGILIAGYVVIIANGAPISFDLFASGAAVFLIILIVVACEYLFKKGKKIYIEL